MNILSNLLFPGQNVHSVYLASPFFNEMEVKVYEKVIRLLRGEGLSVYVPREHDVENAWDLPNHVWGKAVFNADVKAIKECDAMLVLNWGMYSDSGTAWEQGFAFGLGKPVVSVNVNLEDGRNHDFSLMMVNGCDVSLALSALVDISEPTFSEFYQK